MKLVLVAQPRSCSSWLMNQLRTSPRLQVVDDPFGELFTPGYRWRTRELVGLPAMDDAERWGLDPVYADMYWKQNPDGCFKVLAHANGASFYRFLAQRPDVSFVTIQRSPDEIVSALASEIACMIKHRQQGEGNAFKVPAREHHVRYTDIEEFVFNTPDWKRARILEFFYYLLWAKGQRWLTSFEKLDTTIANVVGTKGLDIVERATGATFDWDSLKPQSHYSEIFEDWEVFEEDAKNILGLEIHPRRP